MKVAIVASRARSLINFRGVLLREMVANGHSVTAYAPNDQPGIASALAEFGVTFKAIGLQRTGMNPLRDVGTLRELVGVFRRDQPDVLLSYTIKPVIYGSLAARIAGVPMICSAITGLGYLFIDESPRTRLLRKAVKRMYRAALRVNRVVFFQNPDDRKEFIRLRIVEEGKTHVINGSGVDLDHYTPVPVPEGPVRFLFMGRYIKDKGVLELVEAVRMLKPRYPSLRITFLGMVDTNPSGLTQEAMDALEAEGLIENIGWVEDVRPYVEGCSVYVLPSYREGTPRSVLEALATGRAVITTDAPGCRETVRHGDNGFLVPVRDAAALAEAMARFLEDPALAQTMGQASLDYARERYDVHKVNRAMLGPMGLLN